MSETLKRDPKQTVTFEDTSFANEEAEDDILASMTPLQGSRRNSIYSDNYLGKKMKSRVIMAPVHSHLIFQMLLYYNFFYAFLHFFLLVSMNVYKLWMFRVREYREFLSFFLCLIYLPVEMFTLYFGYVGNIKETVSSSPSSSLVPRDNRFLDFPPLLQSPHQHRNLHAVVPLPTGEELLPHPGRLHDLRVHIRHHRHHHHQQIDNRCLLPAKRPHDRSSLLHDLQLFQDGQIDERAGPRPQGVSIRRQIRK